MSLFQNLKTDGLEDSRDSLGGFAALDSDIYTGKIKVAYAQASNGGAMGITMIAEFNGKEYRETCYVTNKKGENYFLNKNDSSKKVPLPGFTIIDDLCLIATEKPLCEQDTEEKVVMIYDSEAKKELPKSVPVLVDLIGKDICVAIMKKTENKNTKVGDEYVPTADTRDVNNIEKVFHPELHVTVVEAKNGIDSAKFYTAWLEKNQGKTQDKTVDVKDTKTAPKPGVAPSAGATARPSLFGKK